MMTEMPDAIGFWGAIGAGLFGGVVSIRRMFNGALGRQVEASR